MLNVLIIKNYCVRKYMAQSNFYMPNNLKYKNT